MQTLRRPITEDPTLWEFRLRQGVRFHNGNAFDADDVIFTFARARQPTSDYKGYLTSIEPVAKADAHTSAIPGRKIVSTLFLARIFS